MLNKFVFFAFFILFVASHVFSTFAILPSWEEKYSEESSLYLLLKKAVELHKDWLTRFNQVRIK